MELDLTAQMGCILIIYLQRRQSKTGGLTAEKRLDLPPLFLYLIRQGVPLLLHFNSTARQLNPFTIALTSFGTSAWAMAIHR
ncbi:MAG: hypothetical protein M0009_07550 [Deltaproteobacteria bacterium]|nr:hypothetical protein [Deltaproteobacteria bacterium]